MKKSNRWAVLGCFGLSAGLSQFLWLNFAPILSVVQKRYGVTESTASLLILVFPLVYVLLSVHAGGLVDRKGYRPVLLAGCALMAMFSTTRIYLDSFWILLASQIGISIAQPYVVNAVSKVVLDWFPKGLEALATGLGTMGLFVGMATSLALTPVLVENHGLEITMIVCAGISIAVLGAVYLWVHPRGATASAKKSQGFWKETKVLLKKKDLAWIFGLAFLGLGYFNGLTTWLESIVAPNGLDSVQSGIIGGVLILGGIAGSIALPALSDYLKRRKPVLLICVSVGLVTLYPLSMTHSMSQAVLLAAIQGFFFLPAFALLLEMCSEVAGEALAGAATGILMLAGNAGGVIVILAMDWIRNGQATFERAVWLMMAVLALSVGIAAKISETHHSRH